MPQTYYLMYINELTTEINRRAQQRGLVTQVGASKWLDVGSSQLTGLLCAMSGSPVPSGELGHVVRAKVRAL